MSYARELDIYLNEKDSLALRYLMEYEHVVRSQGDLTADEATQAVISFAIRKFWEALSNLELFSKYNSVVVIRDEDGTEREFDWQTVCDGEDYQFTNEPNTTIKINQQDFILLEASLRCTSRFVAEGRYPERDELLRIALRFRATTIRFWNSREKDKREFGINAPRGFLPVF